MEVLDLEKTNALLNLRSHKPDIDKICLYAKDPYKKKYQILINKREIAGVKHFMIQKVLLNTQMIWIIFKKILNKTIQVKNEKY